MKRHKNGGGARFLDGKPYHETPELPRRAALAAWIVDPENPWFARATVNRIWAVPDAPASGRVPRWAARGGRGSR